ncbi:MAG TPA: hypothetical protein VFE14_01225 [Micromonosporaceae bacterium]|jgi:fructoselysine-6-P-deglycase FrlB-like protein|nr:hypothetical protein [Micromonosporaceae bacterium]
MTDFLAAVRAQPEMLERSARSMLAALASMGGAPAGLRTGRLLAFGMGSSGHAAAGFAGWLRTLGRPASALTASLVDGPDLADGYLAISQSGRSRETVEALSVLSGPNRVAMTSYPGAPLGTATDAVLPLDCTVDSRVSTASYTAILQALGLLADALAGRPCTDWAALPRLVAQALDADAGPVADALACVRAVDVIATGHRVASAGAAALLVREALRLPAAAYPTDDYRHGALEVAGPGHGVLVFGAGRHMALAAELAGYGATVILVTDEPGKLPRATNLVPLRLPALPGLAGCVLDIVPVQLAVAELAARRGTPIGLLHMPADTKLSDS